MNRFRTVFAFHDVNCVVFIIMIDQVILSSAPTSLHPNIYVPHKYTQKHTKSPHTLAYAHLFLSK